MHEEDFLLNFFTGLNGHNIGITVLGSDMIENFLVLFIQFNISGLDWN